MQTNLTSKIIAFAIINGIEPEDAIALPSVFRIAAQKTNKTTLELVEIALTDDAIAQYLKKLTLNVAQADRNDYKASIMKG